MDRKTVIKVVVIVASIIGAVALVYPSVRYYTMSMDDRVAYTQKHPGGMKGMFNLGLDLQGGMRLVLEADRSALKDNEAKDVQDRAFTIIQNRIDGLGIAEPSIQKQGQDRLIVELPGLKDEKAAKEVIGRTAQLQFNLQRETAQLERAVRTIDKVLQGQVIGKDTSATTDTLAKKQEDNQNTGERLFGGAEGKKDSASAEKKTDSSAVDTAGTLSGLPHGVTSFRELLAPIGEQVGAKIRDRARVNKILTSKSVRAALENAGLGGNAFFWGNDTTFIEGAPYIPLYYVKAKPEMAGDVIKDAYSELDRSGYAGGYCVELELNHQGANQFSRVTGANVGRNMAIVLDSTVYSAPQIRQKIPLGRAQITGRFSMEEARNLAIVLRAGALPAPLKIVEEQTIGPSLGQDSIRRGAIAGIIGTILVVLFMGIYYGVSGWIANIALILNLLFVLAAMAALNATLSLPGIAGLVLHLAMAVDANVLVYERIREELRVGKTVRSAISAGYSRAFVTIFDSQVTLLISGVILLWAGTGPVRGFAITMILGIIVSFYTALYMVHAVQDILHSRGKGATSISI